VSGGIASPPSSIWKYETSDSGAWLCLFTIATWLDFGLTQHRVVRLKSTIARRSGQTESAVDKQIKRLSKAGKIKSTGIGWSLAFHNDWGVERPGASPTRAILAAPLQSGVKRGLIGLYSFTDFGHQAPAPAPVWPTAAEVAARTGQTRKAVHDQFRKLSALGLMERDPGGVEGSMLIHQPRGLTVVPGPALAAADLV
jgi:hypothetical protein